MTNPAETPKAPTPVFKWPNGTDPVTRVLLNGSVQIADRIEDAPLLTITGHNGVDPLALIETVSADHARLTRERDELEVALRSLMMHFSQTEYRDKANFRFDDRHPLYERAMAALEMAAERFASTPKVAVYCDDAAETIRALLPDDAREPERRG